MEKEFTEKDWKLFRKKIADWQESYMARLNQEYMAILSREDKNPSENFWELEKRIKKDVYHPGVVVEMRRSQMMVNIAQLLKSGVITMTDLEEFSDLFKETIALYQRSYR